MTRNEIMARLKPHILSLCLAAVSKQEGTIAEAIDHLTDAVVSINDDSLADRPGHELARRRSTDVDRC